MRRSAFACALLGAVLLFPITARAETIDEAYQQALLAYHAGEYEQAISEYDVFRRDYPEASGSLRASTLQDVIYCYEERGEMDKAVAAAKERVNLLPKGSADRASAERDLESLQNGIRR